MTPTAVAIIPAMFRILKGSFRNIIAKTAVMAGVVPISIPASMELVKGSPFSKNIRNRKMPNTACKENKKKSFADKALRLLKSFLPQTGNRKRNANIRLIDVIVNTPIWSEINLAETTLVPANENAMNK